MVSVPTVAANRARPGWNGLPPLPTRQGSVWHHGRPAGGMNPDPDRNPRVAALRA